MRRLAAGFVSSLSAFSVFALSSLAQGPLTPPGAPAPTMKTLDQVEPRTPITNLPLTISSPGSYYLVSNLTGTTSGITINSDNVTVDLNGFALLGQPGSLTGITIQFVAGFHQNITVRNGYVAHWGMAGVNLTEGDNVRAENLIVYSNQVGITIGQNSVARNCQSFFNNGHGIQAFAESLIESCVAQANLGNGFNVGDGCRLTGCLSTDNAVHGFLAGDDCVVHQCKTRSNGQDGIRVSSNCTVTDNHCFDDGTTGVGAGIRVQQDENRVEGNLVSQAPIGIRVEGILNFLAENRVIGNTDNHDLRGTNFLNLEILDLPESLDWACNARLGGSLTVTSGDGITVNADDITLDMGGHTLFGRNTAQTGINVPNSIYNLVIRNGVIRDWQFSGVDASDADNSQAHDLRLFNNGRDGISLGNNAVIHDCQAAFNTQEGIEAVSGSTIQRCSAWQNGRFGIAVGNGSSIINCTARENGNGMAVGNYGVVQSCTISDNTTNGMFIGNGCYISQNTIALNSQDGLHVQGDKNHIESNTINGNGTAIDFDSVGNLVVRNSIDLGQFTIFQDPAGNSIAGLADVAGGGFTNFNPWVNLGF